MSVKIIVDSTVDLTPEVKAKVAAIVPLSIRFGDEEYQDGVTINAQKFYDMLVKSEQLPTTSQPTPAAFEAVYAEATADGSEVVVITIASKLSGTYQSATIAAEEFPGKVFVVDSRTAAIGSGILAECALEMAAKGMSGEQILNELIELRKKIRLFLFVDTLEYLHKGGRLNGAVAVVGGVLNFKPILHVDAEGEVKLLTTTRGMKKACASLSELSLKENPDLTKPFLLAYTGNSDENLRQYMEGSKEIWGESPRTSIVGPTIGVHVGPGAVAASFFVKE